MRIKNRTPLYLSDIKDEDIVEYIKPLVSRYGFSFVIRELIRDGIKFRNSVQKQGEGYLPPSPVSTLNSDNYKVLQSNTQNVSSSLENISLNKKPVSLEEIEDRLDNF